jgi:hypothetical protein
MSPNFLSLIFQPQIKHEVFFKVMSDFRRGGLNPDNINEFVNTCKSLPPLPQIRPKHFQTFRKFDLKDLSEEDHRILNRELVRRAKERNKKCWHPNANAANCNTDGAGRIDVSGAHSIQNNGTLNKIAEKGHVKTYEFEASNFDGKVIGRNLASVFWGFCNTHDQIFSPIETEDYNSTQQQNFLFAYRAFVLESHKKHELSYFMNYGEQAENDIENTKEIFDNAILDEEYDVISTDIIELPVYYPIAVSSCFYLDFDFDQNIIEHSDTRMEDIYLTVLPTDKKTLFLISYFQEDSDLYSHLADQIINRNNLHSDLSALIAAHCENIYFNPTYYDTFITEFEESLNKLLFQSQFDEATLNEDGTIAETESFTPSNYLHNEYGINLFGYKGIQK